MEWWARHMRILKNLSVAVLLAASVLPLSASWAGKLPQEVRFAWAGGPRTWVLGQIDKSFDKAFGAPVRWVAFNSGADVLSLFAAREIDIARFGSSPAAAGIARGLPIEVIGVQEIIATSERLIAREGINSLKDLEGKRVAYPANSTAQFAFELAVKLAGEGADRSKIRTVALKPAEMVSAWQRGDIDAAYVWGLSANSWRLLKARKSLQPRTWPSMACWSSTITWSVRNSRRNIRSWL